ncbi:hypothetical protein GGU11DRAFT_774756, partial [Lentinula aff. detonsa]
MRSGGRKAFSTEDDELLVKYLAEFSVTEGRKGTRLYKQLTDNATGQWPWCTRHPWQSWQSRYKRDSEDMERRIRVYKRRQAKAVPASQDHSANANTVENRAEGEKSDTNNLQSRKRKDTPPMESRKQVKRPKKDLPPPIANIGFVRVSNLVRRGPTVVKVEDNKGEGSSRDVAQAKRPSITEPQPQPVNVPQTRPLPSNHDIEEELSVRPTSPSSDDYSGQLFQEMQLDPEADQDDEQNDDVEVDHLLTDTVEPDSDETNVLNSHPLHSSMQTLASTSNSNHEVPRGISDGLTTTADSGFFESTPPINASFDIFDNNPDDTDRASRSLPLSKPRPVPKLVESPFGGVRHKQPVRRDHSSSSSSESESGSEGKKVKDAPAKRDWPPVRGTRKETADTSQQALVTNASSLKRAREQRSEDTSEHASYSGYSQSLSGLVSTQPSRKGKESQIITEDEAEEFPVDQHKPREAERRDVEPLFTQPTQMVQSSGILSDDDSSGEETGENDLEEEGTDEDDETEITKPQHRAQRYADDDNDEPLFTQISSYQLQSQQSHPTSPPRSPSRDPTAASASSSSGSGDEFSSDPDPSPTSHSEFPMPHPFDMPDSQSLYHAPQNPLRRVHPFDMSDAQQQPSTPLVSKTLEHHHPGDIEPPLVSNEAAESVIKALNAFITEMDHSRRTIERNERAHGAGKAVREASPIQSSREESRLSVDMADVATSRERIQASVVRARGSPVPIGVKKQQQQAIGRGTGGIHSPHHDNRLNNKPTGAHPSELGNSLAAGTNSLPVASRSGFEASTQDADLNQRITNRPFYGFFSSSSPKDSGPSIISTRKDKGKNIAIEEGVTVNDPYREEPAQSTSRRSSKQIDLRKLQRAHFRKSSLPTVRNPTSNVNTPASSYAAPDIDERNTHKSSPFSASSSNSLRVGGHQHSP